ncbi:MAG: alpha/beta hydrolase [Phycisphaerales bacterium]
MRPTTAPLRRALLTAAATGAAALAGCSQHLMPTPVGFDEHGGDPFARTVAAEQDLEATVFIAADRKLEKKPGDAAHTFTDTRANKIQMGVATISIHAEKLDWPMLERLSREEQRPERPTIKLTGYEEYGPVWAGAKEVDHEQELDESVTRRFTQAIDDQLARSGGDEIYIFIHGFNTTFPSNSAIAGELFHYLGRRGAMVMFAWPSQGSLLEYQVDKTTANYSVRSLRILLEMLASRTKASRIHILAHSAGAPIAVDAIWQLRLMHYAQAPEKTREQLKLGRLLLVAPDMDLGEFANAVADETTDLPQRTTLYISTHDRALDISQWINGFARLGSPLQELRPPQLLALRKLGNVDVVDVAAAELGHGSWLGHSYFHDDPWVSTDVLLNLRWGVHAHDRGLKMDDKNNVFVFPDGYKDAARAAARKAVEADGKAAK